VDLLVTNHQNLVEESAVFVFEIPDNLETGDFIQHTIATGFETTQPGEGQGLLLFYFYFIFLTKNFIFFFFSKKHHLVLLKLFIQMLMKQTKKFFLSFF